MPFWLIRMENRFCNTFHCIHVVTIIIIKSKGLGVKKLSRKKASRDFRDEYKGGKFEKGKSRNVKNIDEDDNVQTGKANRSGGEKKSSEAEPESDWDAGVFVPRYVYLYIHI
jgi:hypothetical protein